MEAVFAYKELFAMEKKKVGIITLWDNNVGSALQVMATKEILRKHGYTGVILSQRETKLKGKLYLRSCFHFQRLMVFLICPKRFFSIVHTIKKLKASEFHSIDVINEFVSKNIDITEVTYKDLIRIGEDESFSFFVSGSDQVWNYTLGVLNPINFLRFAPRQKRVANAASIGVTLAPPNRWLFKKYLSEFRFISVRETSARNIIKEYTGLSVDVVADPCLQLDAENWRRFYKSQTHYTYTGEKYILLYFLNTENEDAKNAIDYYKANMEIRFIRVSWGQNTISEENEYVIGPDPARFLQLIDNAFIVLTDSFHGVVFSAIFNKEFYYYKRNYVHGVDQSTRVVSLLQELGISERFNPNEIAIVNDSSGIDYSKVNNVLAEKRRVSRDFWNSVYAAYE